LRFLLQQLQIGIALNAGPTHDEIIEFSLFTLKALQ